MSSPVPVVEDCAAAGSDHARKSACWTCRIRHVKCDASAPSCRQCTDRGIECYGFGQQPDWMDGGTKELLKRKKIKLAVKRSFSALRSCQNRARKIGRSVPERADCPSKTVDDPSLIAETLLYSALNLHPPDSALSDTGGQDSTAAAALSSWWEDQDEQQVPFQTREAALLMHYLDDVFQWQFPYYDSSNQHGNRGWLLMLLSRRGPSFYAAISIAALHKACRDHSRGEINATQEALGYRAKALKDLHKLLTPNNVDHLMQNRDHLAEFFACSILLIGFEVSEFARLMNITGLTRSRSGLEWWRGRLASPCRRHHFVGLVHGNGCRPPSAGS